MRQLLVVAALLALAACRDLPPDSARPDARTPDARIDARLPDASPVDAAIDAPVPPDAPLDGPAVPDGIAAARAAADGAGLSLPIRGAIVTYRKPQLGSDPAGFTIQAVRPGPALFIAVDPQTLTPVPAVGDVVDFTITAKSTVSSQPRATALSGFTRSAIGADVAALAQNLSAATDVVTAVDSYDSELITVTGTLASAFTAAGTGFVRASFDSAGITNNASLQLRVPATVIDEIDLVAPCRFTATHVPLARFASLAQIGAFAATELALSGCPAPAIVAAEALSATSVRLTFSRRIDPRSVLANGSQFTFTHGLTPSAAVVASKTITITTSAQDSAITYGVTVAATVTDLQGTPVGGPGASFPGFGTAGGPGAALSVHTTMGIPSPSSTSDPDSYLSVKSGYVISYNSSRKVPNWVSWELNTSYLGSTSRQDDYRRDNTLPVDMPQAELPDYNGSGYDRGHMCPSGDRTLTVAANSQTFFLSNMVPQASNNNQGPWNDLENDSRTLARDGKELFIISGGTFSAGSNTIGPGMVVVPDKTFKVIVVLDAVGDGPADVTASTRVIAVLMPNEDSEISMGADWRSFRVSVDSIEAATGFNFLSDVAPAIQAIVEARVDNQ